MISDKVVFTNLFKSNKISKISIFNTQEQTQWISTLGTFSHLKYNKSMISLQFLTYSNKIYLYMTSIRRSLTEYLIRWNNLEIMAQKVREKIGENPYFQLETVFQRFDKFKKGYLIPDDFSEFMLENKIYPTQIQLYLIFRDFDKERVGVVTLQRLTQELLPKQNAKSNKKALQRKYYEPGLRLSIDLEYIIARYFDHKIKQIQQLSKIRNEMNLKQVYVVEEAFTFLDHQKKGVIQNLSQIDYFLRNNGKVLSKDDLVRLYRVLSFDREGPILYETFSQHLDPLGKGYYIGYSQRISQKASIQQDYLRQKLQLGNEAVRNSRQRILLHHSIEDLQLSNSRLHGLLRQQEIQQRLQQQNISQFRRKRYLQ